MTLDRHQCEVRRVLRLRVESRHSANAYLDKVEERRGKEAADAIRKDARQQWDRGNRGELGKWK